MNEEVMRAAFRDELQKIAGELQGQTRIGRRPISVENYLERETESELTPSDVTETLIQKTAGKAAKAVALMGLGAAGALGGQRAHKDWKTGRSIRIQSKMQQQGY